MPFDGNLNLIQNLNKSPDVEIFQGDSIQLTLQVVDSINNSVNTSNYNFVWELQMIMVYS